MFELLRARINHGRQAIPDIRKAVLPPGFRGLPELHQERCGGSCSVCSQICPTAAIKINPLKIDLGLCTFCGECARECPALAIEFTPAYQMGATSREDLTIHSGMTAKDYQHKAIQVRRDIHKIFGRSFKLRQVSAGGCNGCEMELNACNNVNFDMGRFGIDFVASPRHADGIVITGPVSKNMSPALFDAYKSVSKPNVVIAVGACAISGGVFGDSDQLNRSFFNEIPVDLYIPGCPPHPLTFIHAVLDFLGRNNRT